MTYITLTYLLWGIQVTYMVWIYLLWWIRLIRQQFRSTTVLQIDASQLTLLAVMLHMTDSLIKLKFQKFTQTVAGRNSAEVFIAVLLEVICLRLRASLIFNIFPRSASVGAC